MTLADLGIEEEVRELAKLTNKDADAALRDAVRDALTRERARQEKVRSILAVGEEFRRKYPPTGLKADKAFFDSLYDD